LHARPGAREHRGPLDYAGRVSLRLPASGTAVRAITALYVEQRYGPAADGESLARLKRLSGTSPLRNIALAALFALHTGLAYAESSAYQNRKEVKEFARRW